MIVRCLCPDDMNYYDENHKVKEIIDWLSDNIGNRYTNWNWHIGASDGYWYIDIKDEDDSQAIMFKLKFGV